MGSGHLLRVGMQAFKRIIYFHLFKKLKERRLQIFLNRLSVTENDVILDVGSGNGEFWIKFWKNPWKPKVIGLDLKPPKIKEGFVAFVVADACSLPFKDKSVDVIFSNSVLEHVGRFERQQKMVSEIQRVAKKAFIQVPAKSFPIEPHFLIPFFQFLPTFLQRKIAKNLFGRNDEINLMTPKMLKRLFSDWNVEKEKFLGITKSFYCWKINK